MDMSDAHILHTLRWAPRLASPTATGKTPSATTNTNQVNVFALVMEIQKLLHEKNSRFSFYRTLQPSFQSAFSCWAKDWLIKHGMTSQKADALLFRVGEVAANVSFHVKLAQHFFIEKLAQVRTVQVRGVGSFLP